MLLSSQEGARARRPAPDCQCRPPLLSPGWRQGPQPICCAACGRVVLDKPLPLSQNLLASGAPTSAPASRQEKHQIWDQFCSPRSSWHQGQEGGLEVS